MRTAIIVSALVASLIVHLGPLSREALGQPAGESALLHGGHEDDAIRAATFRRILQSAQNCIRSNVDDLLIGLAETMLHGASLESGIDLLQNIAENCAPARTALTQLRKFNYRTAADIKRNHIRRLGLENYGARGSLSSLARDRRLNRNLPTISGQRNVAVAEYVLDGRTLHRVAVSRATDKRGHAERVLIAELDPRARVTRIYSERHPCSEGCFEAINADERFANATREYSFDHRIQSEEARWFDMVRNNFPIPDAGPSIIPSFPSTIPGF